MKIGIIAPPILKVPPTGYGGLEVVVFDLCEALAEQNHDVTLIASTGSHAKGCRVIETVDAPEKMGVNWIDIEKRAFDIYKYHLREFDIIHDHTWFYFSVLEKFDPANKDMKFCHTHHGHLSGWEPKKLPDQLKPVNLIAISQYMQSEYKTHGWDSRYVYNGVNLNKYPFYDGKRDNRLVFVGRIAKLKGVHIAIKAARETNTPIDIIGGSFVDDTQYLEAIKSECDNNKDLCSLHLDLTHEKKLEFIQHAKACLIPSNFQEPFGLTAVESIATGCPAIVWDDGALHEIINTPKVGSVCRDYDAFLKAVKGIDTAKYDKNACRERAEYFSREKMAERYVKVYQDVIDGKGW